MTLCAKCWQKVVARTLPVSNGTQTILLDPGTEGNVPTRLHQCNGNKVRPHSPPSELRGALSIENVTIANQAQNLTNHVADNFIE
jgi:hypothetical protein